MTQEHKITGYIFPQNPTSYNNVLETWGTHETPNHFGMSIVTTEIAHIIEILDNGNRLDDAQSALYTEFASNKQRIFFDDAKVDELIEQLILWKHSNGFMSEIK